MDQNPIDAFKDFLDSDPRADPPRVLDKDTVICSNLEQVQKMYEGNNVINKGIRPQNQQEKDAVKEEEIKTFRVPNDVLTEFETIDESN